MKCLKEQKSYLTRKQYSIDLHACHDKIAVKRQLSVKQLSLSTQTLKASRTISTKYMHPNSPPQQGTVSSLCSCTASLRYSTWLMSGGCRHSNAPASSKGSLDESGDDGDDKNDDAEDDKGHAGPPALARGVDEAHALDALLMAACQKTHCQLFLRLHRR